jgi:hypothetical protein
MMKKISLILTVIFAISLLFTSCDKNANLINADIVPDNFKVDIPNSLSNASDKASKDDVLDGNDIYGHLTTFIAVGEGAADIVQGIMRAIRRYDLDQAMSFSFESDEDGRTKSVVIIENSSFEGQIWEYQLTMKDEDGGTALQVFWNNSPVKGIAILNPYNIDRTTVNEWSQSEQWTDENTMYRVDYSEAETDYEAQMIVYISGLKLPDSIQAYNRFAMETLKMFAGKKGNVVDVYGNSNHPKAYFFDDTKEGFNWAFVAAGNDVANIGIAEVGLPPSYLDETSRTVLLETHSIHNVFETELTALGYSQTDIDVYLAHTLAPGYFANGEFLQAGTSPGSSYDEIQSSMETLSPYNPIEISNLSIQFKDDDASL